METDQNFWNRPEKGAGIRALMAWNRCYIGMYHQLKLHTPCPLPAKGPAILVSNHIGSLDPMFIQSTSPRLIRWMMAKEYFQIKAIRWVFSAVGVILVERSGRDMAATRAAMRALEDGYILGVFPEGKFSTTKEFLPFQNGIGLLALKSGAPVFPAYIDGAQRGKGMVQAFIESNVCNLTYGQRVRFQEAGSSRHRIEAAARQIQQSIESLRDRK